MQSNPQSLVTRLRVVSRIKRELDAAKASGFVGLKHYRQAGVMFIALKRKRPKSFDRFCRDRFDVSHEWRSQMMRLATNWDIIVRARKRLRREGKLMHTHATLRGANALVPVKQARDSANGAVKAKDCATTARAYEELEVCAFEQRLTAAEKKRVMALCTAFNKAANDASRLAIKRDVIKTAAAHRYRVRRLLEIAGCEAKAAKAVYTAIRSPVKKPKAAA